VESVTIKKKTHGFLPLFVSQFFFLLAALGVGAVLFVLPEKQLKEIQGVSAIFSSHLISIIYSENHLGSVLCFT